MQQNEPQNFHLTIWSKRLHYFSLKQRQVYQTDEYYPIQITRFFHLPSRKYLQCRLPPNVITLPYSVNFRSHIIIRTAASTITISTDVLLNGIIYCFVCNGCDIMS